MPYWKIRSLTPDRFAVTVNRTESPNLTPLRTGTVTFSRQVLNWSALGRLDVSLPPVSLFPHNGQRAGAEPA